MKKVKKVLCLVLMAAVLLSVTAVPVSVSAEPIARYRWFDRTNYGGAATTNPDCSSLGAGITRSYVNGLFGKGNDDESHCVTKAAGTALGNDNYLPRASRTAQINGGFLQYGDKVVASAKIATGDTNGNKRFYMTLFFTGNSTTTYVTPYTYNYSFELRGSALWAFNNNTGITLSRNRWYTVTLVYTAGQEGTVQNTCDVYVDGKFITTKNFGVSAANGSNDFNTSLAAMTGVGEVRAEISNSAAASAADIYIDDFTVDVYMGQDAASFNVANALPASMANAVISNNPYISISDEIETGANRLNSRTIDVYKENLGGSNFTKSAFLSGVNVAGTPRIYAADDAKLQTPLLDTTEIVNGMVMVVESADKKMIKYYNINIAAGSPYVKMFADNDFSGYNPNSYNATIAAPTYGGTIVSTYFDANPANGWRPAAHGIFGKNPEDQSFGGIKPVGQTSGETAAILSGRSATIDGTNHLQYGDKVVLSAKIATADMNNSKRFYMQNLFTGNTTNNSNYVSPYTYSSAFEWRNGSNAIYAFNEDTGIRLSNLINRWYTVNLVYTAGNGIDIQNTCETYVNGKLIATKNFGVAVGSGSEDFNTSYAAMTGIGAAFAAVQNYVTTVATTIYVDEITVYAYMGPDAASFNVAEVLPVSMANAVTGNNPYITVSPEVTTGAERLNPRAITVDKDTLEGELGGTLTITDFLGELTVTGTPRIYATDDAKLQTPLLDTTEITDGMVMAVESTDGKMIKYYNIYTELVGIAGLSEGELDGDMITGINYGTTAGELKGYITTLAVDNAVKVTTSAGVELNNSQVVSNGCRVVVSNSGGTRSITYPVSTNGLIILPPVFTINGSAPSMPGVLTTGTVRVSYTVESAEPDARNANAIIAVYEGQALVNVNLSPGSTGVRGDIITQIYVDDPVGKKVRAFLWTSDMLMPVADTDSLSG